MSNYWFCLRTATCKIRTYYEQAKKMNDEIRAAAELAKDPASISVWTYVWMIGLSLFGGVVRVAREVHSQRKPFKEIIAIFVVEMLTSAFAGLITFLLCQASEINPMYTAIFTSLAGWMGVRALIGLEALYKTRSPKLD